MNKCFLKSYPVQGWDFSCKVKEYSSDEFWDSYVQTCMFLVQDIRSRDLGCTLLSFDRPTVLAKGCSLVRRDQNREERSEMQKAVVSKEIGKHIGKSK